MFVAAGAGRTVGPDAGFADFRQGAFDGRPELLELAEKILPESKIGRFWMLHGMYILSYTYIRNKKNEKLMAHFPAVTEALLLLNIFT
jgi:hypothetical protein